MTDATPALDLPVPSRAAREAAASWAKSNSRHAQAANIMRGSCDASPIVQAFARFERALMPERDCRERKTSEQRRYPDSRDKRALVDLIDDPYIRERVERVCEQRDDAIKAATVLSVALRKAGQ